MSGDGAGGRSGRIDFLQDEATATATTTIRAQKARHTGLSTLSLQIICLFFLSFFCVFLLLFLGSVAACGER